MCGTCKDQHISKVRLRAPTHGHNSVGRPSKLMFFSSVWTFDAI